jgi:hypothetical protein
MPEQSVNSRPHRRVSAVLSPLRQQTHVGCREFKSPHSDHEKGIVLWDGSLFVSGGAKRRI